MSVTVCDVSMVTSVTVCGGGPGGGCKFLPLKLQHFLSVRVSQNSYIVRVLPTQLYAKNLILATQLWFTIIF